MKGLVPRLVGEPEAKRLGIQHGWYGAKISGTFVTGPSESLDACIIAMDLIPEPPKVIGPTGTEVKVTPVSPFRMFENTKARTPYGISRKPSS
jgi:hypothetical protein